MDTPLLTIGEAVEMTGRSPSTIRRIIRAITDENSHPDRSAIEPTPKQVDAFKKKGENFTWRIRKDVLEKNLQGAPVVEKKKAPQMSGDILSILQHELNLKNQQIEKQFEVIQSLNERLREGNILMGTLQKRLALPAAEPVVEEVVEASTTTPATEAAKKATKKNLEKAVAKEKAAAPKKKGVLSWMWR
jgi:hypothetical protein